MKIFYVILTVFWIDSYPHLVNEQQITRQFTSEWNAQTFAKRAIKNGCTNVQIKEVIVNKQQMDTTIFIYPVSPKKWE